MKCVSLLLIAFLIALFLPGQVSMNVSAQDDDTPPTRIIGYFTSWGIYDADHPYIVNRHSRRQTGRTSIMLSHYLG